MTTRNWNGGNGSFSDLTQWTPNGVPTSGDIAVISSGTVLASALNLAGLTIDLNANATAAGTLTLANTTISGNTTLTVDDANAYGGTPYPYVNIQGTVTNAGTLNFTGSVSYVQFASGATLINTGTISISDASPNLQPVSGAGTPTIQNNGTISVTRPDLVYQSPVISANVTGNGTINLGAGGKIDFNQGVSSGQVLSFTGALGTTAVVQVDNVAGFNPVIDGFIQGDTITVTNKPYTGYNYVSNGSSGTLNLLNGSAVVGSLNLTGIYSNSTFTLSYQQSTGNTSNLIIQTDVINPATGQIAANPVYRFFDKVYGTHLFTQSTAEAQQILATRPDLAQETNNFGAVSSTSPSAEPVYRFFEQANGTHFYTASQTEFQGLTTPGSASYRSDFTYESSSTIFEDSTQQAGDVPVYRLFDAVHGTQFLTGSQSEYAGLTTPGSGTYRSDLTSEGVAFFAPAGTFSA